MSTTIVASTATTTGMAGPYMIATITLAGVVGLLAITLVTVWCCYCRLQRQVPSTTSYASTQYVTKEAPVIREVPNWGEAPYSGMDVSGQVGGSGYDWMGHGQQQQVMTPALQPSVSNFYAPSPMPDSCGPKKEFERVLLNPQSTACTKPVSSPAPVAAAAPSCTGNSCTNAQFVLQSASDRY